MRRTLSITYALYIMYAIAVGCSSQTTVLPQNKGNLPTTEVSGSKSDSSTPAAEAGSSSLANTEGKKNSGGTNENFATCEECKQKRCTSYSGIDLVKACYGREQKDRACSNFVKCAQEKHCFANHPNECYCGTATMAECLAGQANGACKKETEAASLTKEPSEIAARFADPQYPIGNGVDLLLCYRARCNPICM